jgi:sugar phosphate isomerase/epimerase
VTTLELWSYTFRQSTLLELGVAAAAAGFDAVTVTPELFVRSGGHGADLRARVEDLGVCVTFVDGLCSALPGAPGSTPVDGSFADPHEATLDDCIRIAHATGAGAINLVHIRGAATPIPELAEGFARACNRAASEDLRLAIEFLPGTGIPDLATAAAVVREAGAVNGSVLLDTWHFARGGGVLDDLDPATVALVGGLQLSDRSPEQDREPYVPRRGRKLPGDGALPLPEMVARVLDAHHDLPVGVEVLSDQVDALGLDQGCRAIGDALRLVVEAAEDLGSA